MQTLYLAEALHSTSYICKNPFFSELDSDSFLSSSLVLI